MVPDTGDLNRVEMGYPLNAVRTHSWQLPGGRRREGSPEASWLSSWRWVQSFVWADCAAIGSRQAKQKPRARDLRDKHRSTNDMLLYHSVKNECGYLDPYLNHTPLRTS